MSLAPKVLKCLFSLFSDLIEEEFALPISIHVHASAVPKRGGGVDMFRILGGMRRRSVEVKIMVLLPFDVPVPHTRRYVRLEV
jgi:hypothetical protein